MTKTIAAALIASVFALPVSYALAAPQHSGGHAPSDHSSMPMSSMHMNQDMHGDAVSGTAHMAKANGTKVGKTVSPVASSKNKGKHEAKGHAKTHHKH
ncbi:hypothetical protein [Rhodanobacter sp. DHG33]|uniref:hypothetical protein n=1 Tax=Rhodanobacter sp. DHG33 TaxID=2775921 RepID=UPI0017863C1B|nr:hypothetical protein [Rhodanobacter sp. DHG33]MBD8900507.1 hypothetical protein [Rhodanobacter sp. DHG33]